MEPARLEFTDSSGNARVVALEQSPFRIGRSTSNDLSLASAEVSREHAQIEWEDDRYVLRDKQSRAGTFVNGDPVEEHALEPGDRIRVGPTLELVFAVGPIAAADDDQTSSTSTAITDLRQTATLLEGLRALGSARVLDHVLDLVLDSAIDVLGSRTWLSDARL